MEYRIKDVQVVEDSDYTFFIVFNYKDKTLNTITMDRNIRNSDILANIVGAIEIFVQARADDNFQTIKNKYSTDKMVIEWP